VSKIAAIVTVGVTLIIVAGTVLVLVLAFGQANANREKVVRLTNACVQAGHGGWMDDHNNGGVCVG
jgi:hypothetical protein